MAAPPGGPQEEPWTIARVLTWAAQDFKKRGLETARLDAELLLSRVLGVDRIRLIVDSLRELSSEELVRFRALIKRRRAAEPIAYILGEREFYGMPFRVDARVLVPRPDTEILVEAALERTRSRDMYGRMLDLCTGSGCVVLAFAKQRRTWRYTATDVSADALAVARDNARRLGLTWNVRFVEGDLDATLGESERFDLITANPPYISDVDMDELDATIRDYEPNLALRGGADGLDVVRRIVERAPARLSAGGVLALEVGYDQAARTAELFERAGFVDIERRRDFGGHERVVSGQLGSR